MEGIPETLVFGKPRKFMEKQMRNALLKKNQEAGNRTMESCRVVINCKTCKLLLRQKVVTGIIDLIKRL